MATHLLGVFIISFVFYIDSVLAVFFLSVFFFCFVFWHELKFK